MLSTYLLKMWTCIHGVLDCLIDFAFSLLYANSPKRKIPSVQESFLVESAVSLSERIRNKEISAVKVVQGFINRIQEVNPIINAVVDQRYDDAIQEAKEVDLFLASTQLTAEEVKQKKPFLGVPFTTKDSTSCKGLSYTLGLVCRKHYKGTQDADVVTLMKNAGGILLAVTNIPEVNMWCETRNNVYGETLNPYDTTRTVGGSSGGEASIIAASGSPLGIGTDIGGSIRMPAFFCGVFGHKPTTGLTPMKGLTRRTGLEKHTMATAGPICRYAQDLAPFLKILVGKNEEKLQLEREVNPEDIKFYYMEETGDPHLSSVCGELRRILQKAVSHCQDISKTPAQQVQFPETKHSFKLWRYWMSKEPSKFAEELANRQGRVSFWEELPKKLIGRSDYTLAAIMRLGDGYLQNENSTWAEETTENLCKKLQEILGENGVLLCSSHAFPAVHHYSSFLRPYNFASWAIFNVLHLPVTQVPMGLSRNGLPLGLQVVAGKYNDHLCLAVAKELQKAFGGWVPPFTI